MDKEWIRQRLPKEPPQGLLKWTLDHCEGELGANYLVWNRETVPVYEMAELMNGWKPVRKERVARCRCFSCGGEFLTEVEGDTLGLWVDDCGDWWPIDPTSSAPWYQDAGDEINDMGYTVETNGDGDRIQCPFCRDTLTTIHKKKLRGGRYKQILVASIEQIEGYAAVVYWLVRRTFKEDYMAHSIHPRDAYVLDEKGRLHRYSHKSGGGYVHERQEDCWRITSHRADSLDMCYHDWGSISNKKKGGFFYPEVPDLTGTTAEKTGLQAFAGFDGLYSVEYLKLWRMHPNLENLVNTGWNRLVQHIVAKSFEGYLTAQLMDKVLDLTKTKPNEMLCMSRSEFKAVRQTGRQWDYNAQKLWLDWRVSGHCSARQFLIYRDMFTDAGILALAELGAVYGDRDVEKLIRYLKKQGLRPEEVRILLDARNMAGDLKDGGVLTQEELWPRNLQSTHDRLTRAKIAEADAKTVAKYQAGFDAVIEKYGQLQWTDGELCMILPKSYAELKREGDTLRHCVGGYSDDHIRGEDTIFFVRHYRRPERCYYTLDINMTDIPKRVQLHGYGNERHGINKQYRHTIPRKVKEFCARWEREVLMPWWRDNQQKKEKIT